VLPSSNLSPSSQRLYNCVSGDKFTLNTPDFPDFIKAIEYSIATPGLWCNTTLKSKQGEFGKSSDPAETYLRITLGKNNGESPGIPYVLEIWPVGHYSPIHNHGGSSAIIRVLNGSVNVKLFPFLCDDKSGIEPFAKTDLKVGDITWISPTLNQVHQLKNEGTKDTCMTIQCYMYEVENDAHYDYFDYVDTDGSKKQFEPDSDADFLLFKSIIQQEWATRNNQKSVPNCFPFWLQTT
jgi:quercetin dioxygenase-like cupin family protein